MARDPKQTEREVAVFSRFLEAHASLAANTVSFNPAPGDFPDIVVEWKDGGSAGYELGEWLHAQQMAEAKRKEKLRAKLQDVLWQCTKQRPHHFEHVAVEVRDATFDRRHADEFATEFLRVVSDIHEGWHQKPWREHTGYPLIDFSKYPTLGRYVQSILFWPLHSYSERILREALSSAASDPEISWERSAEEARGRIRNRGLQVTETPQAASWIQFSTEGGAYSSESALQALAEILSKKTSKYSGQQAGDLGLIIYYDEAVLHNTPYQDQGHETFGDIACEAARFLAGKNGAPFTKIYLLRALWPNPEAFEVWPSFSRCA